MNIEQKDLLSLLLLQNGYNRASNFNRIQTSPH